MEYNGTRENFIAKINELYQMVNSTENFNGDTDPKNDELRKFIDWLSYWE